MVKYLQILALAMALTGLLANSATAQLFGEQVEDETPIFNLNAAIRTEGVYESNIYQTKFNPVDDYYLVVQPQAALHLGYEPFFLDLAYQPRFYFFSKNLSNDGVDTFMQDLRFNTTVFATNHVKLVVQDHLGMVPAYYGRPATPTNLVLQNRFTPQLIFAYELDSRTVFESNANFERVDVKFPGQDFYSYGGSVGLTRELTNMLSAMIQGTTSKSIYDNYLPGNNTSLRGEGGFLINWNDRLSSRLTAHYDYLIYEIGPNYGAFGGTANVSYLATETTHVGAEVQRELSVDLFGQAVTSTFFKASISQDLGSRTQVFGEAYFNIYDIPQVNPQDDRTWGTRIGASYLILENLRAEARYELDNNIGPTTYNDFVDHRGIISLDYDFGSLVNLF